jgi:hypothetical protein
MAKFFVGQRVLLARPLHPENRGLTGRIIALKSFVAGDWVGGWVATDAGDVVVSWDVFDTPGSSETWRLEPILPEGHQPAESRIHRIPNPPPERRKGEGMKKLSDRLISEADSWESWNNDHPNDICAPTPQLLREAAALARRVEDASIAIMDRRDALGICAPAEEDFPALYALQGQRVAILKLED